MKRYRFMRVLFMGLLSVLTALFLWEGVRSGLRPDIYSLMRSDLSARWYQEAQFSVSRDGSAVIYSFTLPDLDENYDTLSVCFFQQWASISLDGELVYRSESTVAHARRHSPGRYWALVPLQKEDAHRLVRIVVTGDRAEAAPIALISNDGDLLVALLRRDFFPFFVSIMSLLVGACFVLPSILFPLEREERRSRIWLGVFLGMMGFYRIESLPVVTMLASEGRTLLPLWAIGFIVPSSFLLLPLALTRFVAWERRLKRPYQVLSALLAVETAALVALHILGLRDIHTVAPLQDGVFVAVMVLLVALDVFAMKRGELRTDRQHVLSVVLFLPTIAETAERLAFGQLPGNIASASVLAFGVYRGFSGLRGEINSGEKLRRAMDELSDQRAASLMGQMRQHFIYNTMNAIYSLCDIDLERAKTAIQDFTNYLRANYESLGQSAPVPFAEELERVRCYLSIEKMRFQDRLNVVWEIEREDFSVPPLSVQPLVENAIVHGLRKRTGPGTVTISAREEGDEWVVSVRDDGVGFDPAAISSDGRWHLGIENTRTRLWIICRGTLSLTSAPGEGTTAVIRLPKEGVQ